MLIPLVLSNVALADNYVQIARTKTSNAVETTIVSSAGVEEHSLLYPVDDIDECNITGATSEDSQGIVWWGSAGNVNALILVNAVPALHVKQTSSGITWLLENEALVSGKESFISALAYEFTFCHPGNDDVADVSSEIISLINTL